MSDFEKSVDEVTRRYVQEAPTPMLLRELAGRFDEYSLSGVVLNGSGGEKYDCLASDREDVTSLAERALSVDDEAEDS